MFSHSKTDRVRQLAKNIISNAPDWARTSRDLAWTGSHRAKTFINKKPMAATLIGLAVGYLLGKLFSKRKPSVMVSAPEKAAKRGRSSRS